VIVTVVVPMATPSATEILPTPTATATESPIIGPDGYPRMGGWLLTLLALFGSVGLAFWAVSRVDSPQWGLRAALCMLIGGLAGYNYLALGFPSAAAWVASDGGATGVLLLTFTGEIVGGIGCWVWRRWFSAPA
jgi:hypothetical protein